MCVMDMSAVLTIHVGSSVGRCVGCLCEGSDGALFGDYGAAEGGARSGSVWWWW